MRSAADSVTRRSLAAAVAVLATTLIGLTAVAAGSRFTYPYELEWMEGATVVHVARLTAGLPIYVAPTVDFVPFGYPALYYYAAVVPSAVMGTGFVPLRLVSVAATLLTLVAIALIVYPVSGRLAAFAASGAYAGAYSLSDGWFDLGRVDALYVALLGLAYVFVVRARTPAGWAIAGILAATAFTTKQPALVVFAPLLLYLLVADLKAAAWFGGSAILLAAAVFAAFTFFTDGWYAYYVVELPRLRLRVSSGSGRLLSFWTADLLPFAIALVGGVALVVRAREWRHLALLGGLIVSSWLSRLEGGAWNNAVMPGYLGCAVLLGLAMRRAAPAPALRLALAGVQLAVLVYDPRVFMPSKHHRAAGAAFVETLRALPRPALVLEHGHLPTLAGQPEYAHGWAVVDVLWADGGGDGQTLEAEMRAAIRAHRFAAIITDEQPSWFSADVEGSYQRVGEVEAPLPLVGAPRRPRYLYMPR